MVKSRKNPEKNVSNRHLRGVATRGSSFVALDPDDFNDVVDQADVHPLVHNDARNSMVDSNRIVWPLQLTKSNSIASGIKKDIEPRRYRELVLLPILGAAACAPYHGIAALEYTMRSIMIKVQKGLWKLGLKEREDIIRGDENESERLNRQVGKTRSSWFKIHSSNVPHYQRAADDVNNEHLYGRIHCFAQLTVPAWRPEPFQLAKVRLYEVSGVQAESNLQIIRTDKAVGYVYNARPLTIKYVQVRDIVGLIAVGPVIVKDRAEHIDRAAFYVLPIKI
jgi:hypothetical protein